MREAAGEVSQRVEMGLPKAPEQTLAGWYRINWTFAL